MDSAAVLPAGVRERFRWFSLRPYDQSTAEGRANERHRRVALTAAAAALAKVLSIGAALITVPMTLHYLGPERFGMWMTISSLIAMLAFADFGIANGVLNTVAKAHGNDDRMAIRHGVSSGFFLLTAVATSLIALFAAVYAFVPWHTIFNVSSELARAEAGPALAVFVLCFALAIPCGMVQRVQLGLQQGFTASLWQCAGSLLGIIGLLLTIRAEGGLPWLVLSLAGVPLLSAAANSISFYLVDRPDLRPRLSQVTRKAMRQVAATGALFFVLQLTVAAAYASDSIVIAQLMGASAVAQYAVPEKLFSLVSLALGIALAPLWPAYGEALARGDRSWVSSTLKRSVILAFGVALALSGALFVCAPLIISVWVGDAVVVPISLLAGLALWKCIEAVGTAVAFFLNGANVIRLQLFVAVGVGLSAIGLKVYLVPILGVAGAVWATVIAYLLFAAVPYAVMVPRMIRGQAQSGSS